MTPSRVKEAFFSMIGGSTYNKSFLDLFSCSGQIGIEAISRGAEPVIMNEKDRIKFSFIKSTIDAFEIKSNVFLQNLTYQNLIKQLGRKKNILDIIFIDPPYIKKREKINLYDNILEDIEKNSILKRNGIICIQHYKDNILSEKPGCFKKVNNKNYGTTALTFYENNFS